MSRNLPIFATVAILGIFAAPAQAVPERDLFRQAAHQLEASPDTEVLARSLGCDRRTCIAAFTLNVRGEIRVFVGRMRRGPRHARFTNGLRLVAVYNAD
jgi:hypothetical protein